MNEWHGKIIDAHVHTVERLCGFGFRGEMRSLGNGRIRWATGEEAIVLPDGLESFPHEKLICLLDENNVDLAVMMQGPYFGFQNDYVHEAQVVHKGRLYGMGTLDPYCILADRLMHRFIEEFQFLGLKIEMSQSYGLMGWHPDFLVDSQWMRPVFEYAQRKGFCVSLDMSSFGEGSMQANRLGKLAKHYPDIHIMAEHFFLPGNDDMDVFARTLDDLARYENVMFTVASIPNALVYEPYPFETARAFIRKAKSIVGARRIVWGTDCPGVLTKYTYTELKNFIAEDDLFTQPELEMVYYGNAEKFYNLTHIG